MTRVLVVALALLASLVQVGALPALFFDPLAAPLLPVALLAAWGALRGPEELWPAFLVAPLPLALLSEERLGWFLLALLPTAGLLLRRRPDPDTLAQFARAPLVAALGALGYLALLWLAAGDVRGLPGALTTLVGAALLTAVASSLFAVLLWPLRARRAPGLFR
ncbi:MAG: hypothetical protein AB7I38_10060 [Dehalococcoidia bacterium]